jgi:hypothetical protein
MHPCFSAGDYFHADLRKELPERIRELRSFRFFNNQDKISGRTQAVKISEGINEYRDSRDFRKQFIRSAKPRSAAAGDDNHAKPWKLFSFNHLVSWMIS